MDSALGANAINGWPSRVLTVGLVLSIVLLLVFNLHPSRTMYQLFGAAAPPDQQATIAAIKSIDQRFTSTAAGGNLLLHLPGYDLGDSTAAMRAGGLYYRANYVLFPQRAFVGDRVRVINMASQLIPNDDTPPPAWMTAHDIRGICVFPGPAARR